jgi:hypothetical protein
MAQDRGTSHRVEKQAGVLKSIVSFILRKKTGIQLTGAAYRRSKVSLEIRFFSPKYYPAASVRARFCCSSR